MPRVRQVVRDRSPQQNGDPLVGSQDRRSLVGWGIGEDELREQSSGSAVALGVFFGRAKSSPNPLGHGCYDLRGLCCRGVV
jgi:hypothetical protein